jgi:RNA polymerase sigma-70 factor, ECF subfamily
MTNWSAILANDGPAVWRTLWRLLGRRCDVEECFQETFVAALELSRRQAVQSWPALLCSLATARAMDQLRKRYRRSAFEQSDAGPINSNGRRLTDSARSADPGPMEQAVAAELSERLREALARLPERQAEIFYLSALCGWSHHELAQRMQMTENAVAVNIHRARERLRELLNDQCSPKLGRNR